MATIADITVPADSYIDLYTEAGLADGTAIQIVNKGSHWVYIQEDASQPAGASLDGRPITTLTEPNPIVNIASGSAKIWAKASGKPSKVNVEEA